MGQYQSERKAPEVQREKRDDDSYGSWNRSNLLAKLISQYVQRHFIIPNESDIKKKTYQVRDWWGQIKGNGQRRRNLEKTGWIRWAKVGMEQYSREDCNGKPSGKSISTTS